MKLITDKKGNPVEIVGTWLDVSETRTLEEVLQKQNEELQIIIDSVPAWIFYKDKENRFIHVNRAFCEVMKIPKEQLEGVSCFDIYPKEQAEDFWKDDLEVMKSEKPKRNIIEPVKTDEGIFWAKTDKIPYRDTEGNIIGIIGFTLDITEATKAESKIKISEKRHRSLITATAQIVWTTNAGGDVEEDMPDLRTFTGQSHDQIKGWGWLNSMHPDDQEKNSSSLEEGC